VHEIKAFNLSVSTAAAVGSYSALKQMGSSTSSLKSRSLCYSKQQRLARHFSSQHAVRSRERMSKKAYREDWES
jgi:hypothetical protein